MSGLAGFPAAWSALEAAEPILAEHERGRCRRRGRAVSLVHRFEPAAPGSPTLLALHGRGGAEGDLQGLGDALGGGVGVLAPRGPEPQGGGFAWFRHHAIGVPELPSLEENLALVAAWLDAAVAEHGLEAPLVAVGFSNGGMMAGALAAVRPDLVGDVALLSSAYPLPAQTLAHGGLSGSPGPRRGRARRPVPAAPDRGRGGRVLPRRRRRRHRGLAARAATGSAPRRSPRSPPGCAAAPG